jgi:aquaporin Z
MDDKSTSLKPIFVELAGTFALVFAGCGSAVFDGSKIGPLGVALAFGLAVLAMVYSLGPISGCHINPAVTIGLALSGNFGWRQVPGYIAAQVIGGIFAAAALFLIAHTRPGFNPAVTGFAANGYGLHSLGPGNYGVLAAFVTEGILTALLVLTVLGSTGAGAKTDLAGFAIGLVVTAALLVGIPITGASINPALAWRRLSLWVAGRSANCGSLSLHRSPVPH